MRRYLLFDSGCALCTSLARDVSRISDGWLTPRSLHDPEIQQLLSRSQKDWKWEPILLEVNDENVRVYTGLALRAKLTTGLGPQRAWRIAHIVAESFMSMNVSHRRNFLRRSVAAVAGTLFGAGVLSTTSAESINSTNVNLSPKFQRISGDEAQILLKRAFSTPQFSDFQQYLDKQFAGRYIPQEEGALVHTGFIKSGQSLAHVSIPISGGTELSFWSILFDIENGSVLATTDALISYDQNANIAVLMRSNDRLVVDATMNATTGAFVSGVGYKPDGTSVNLTNDTWLNSSVLPDVVVDFRCCVNNCLAAQGINQLIIALTIGFCSIACLVPGINIATCAACLAAASIGLPLELLLLCINGCSSGDVFGGCTGG